MDALDIIRRVARYAVSVLLVGEDGLDREPFARALHRSSSRADRAFVVVDCAAMPDDLGHCAGGTLFLDHVDALSLDAQDELLRALQQLDVRIVAGTHRDLDAMVAAGTFRADLCFHVSVVPVQLPALPDRGSLHLRTALEETERRLIRTALERSSGNRTTAAALLGLNRTTLVEKLRKYEPRATP
jgi:DNA-binding NtrC family response regulator